MSDPIDSPPAAPVAASPLAKLANPGPLGLAGFGLTTVLLSLVNAGILPHESVAAIVPLAFAYGGVAQLIAGVLEFKAGNTFGMVAFTSYGLFWWWFALLQWTIGAGWLKAPPPAAGGTVLLVWGIFTLLMWMVSFRLSKAVWSIFLLLTITFFLLAWGDFGYSFGSIPCGQIGGWFGLATGLDALFVAFIEVLNATANRTVIPLGAPFLN
jgi:succinate-acetate transporter protein